MAMSIEKRNAKMVEMYAKIDKKTGKRVHSTRSIAEKFGISKTRSWEILSKHSS